MRLIAAVFSVAAIAVLACGCGNQNPDITITHQALAGANEQSGRELRSGTATTAPVSSQTQTLALVTRSGVQLQRMYDATHRLATLPGAGAHEAQSELERVAQHFDALASRARLLPASDPARALLVAVDMALRNAATSLQHEGLNAGRDALLSVTGPTRRLQSDIARIGRKVASGDRTAIQADLQTLSNRVAVLGNGT